MLLTLLRRHLPTSYWLVVRHLWSSGIANLASGMNIALLTLAAHVYDWTSLQFGALLATGAIMRIILHTQLPRLMARYGNPPRWLMQSGLLITILPLALWPDNYWLWLVLLSARGLFTALSYFMLNTQILALCAPAERTRVLSLYQMTGTLWLSLGIGAIALVGLQWYSFMAIAILSCAAGWIVTPQDQNKVDAQAPGLSGLLNALRQGRVVWGFSLLAGLTVGAIGKYLGLYALDRGFSHDQAMLVMSLFIIGGCLAQYPLSSLLDRKSKREVTLALLGISVVLVALMHLSADNFFLTVFFVALWGAVAYVLTPAVQSILGDRFNGPDRLYAMAAHALLFNLGDIIGALVLGVWMDMIGPVAVVYTFMLAASLLFMVAFKPKLKTMLDQTDFAMWGLNLPLLLKVKKKGTK